MPRGACDRIISSTFILMIEVPFLCDAYRALSQARFKRYLDLNAMGKRIDGAWRVLY